MKLDRFLPLASAVAAAALLASCGSPEHVNEFDPQTPPGLQAKAVLVGSVSLEAVGSEDPPLDGVNISVPGAGATLTNVLGEWRLTGVSPGTYTVQTLKDGYETVVVGGVLVRLDDGGQDLAVAPVAMKVARGEVSGTVSLEGEPLAGGVTVSLSGVPLAAAGTAVTFTAATSTDEAGRYRFIGVPTGSSYQLAASRVGFLGGGAADVVVAAGRTTTLPDLPLAANPGRLSGTVQVVGAADSFDVTVRVSGTTLAGTAHADTTTTDAAGAWLLPAVPAGSYNVAFEKTDYAAVSMSVTVAPGADAVLPPVGLERDTGGVIGTALLEGAFDSSGIQVSLTPLPTAGNPTPTPIAAALTASTGTWSIDVLPVGTYTVSYEKQPGYAPASGSVTVVSHAVVTAATATLAAIPGRIDGRVQLEGAAAGGHGGVTVRLEGTTRSTVSLADGSYQLDGVGAGAQVVVFERVGYTTQRVQAVTAPGEVLTLFDVLLPISRGGIAGRFTLGGAGSSAGVVVTADGPVKATAVTDASGDFAFSGLPVGVYAVSGRRDPEWQPTAPTAVTVVADATAALPGSPVAMAPVVTASVSGTALLEGAADHSATTVSLTGADFRGLAVSRTTTTAATGAWSVSSLAAGSYQVTFTHSGWETPAPTGLSVPTAAAASAGTVTLAASRGDVAGTVTATGALSQAGTVVTVSGGPDAASTVTDAAGAWRVTGLRVGTTYVATYQRPSYASATSVTFAVTADATTAVSPATLSLSTSGSIAGTATVERGSSSGIAVDLAGTDVNGGAVLRATATNASGAYAFPGLPDGTYGLAFSKASYDPASASGLPVTGSAVTAPSVVLSVSKGTVAGTAQLSAGTVTGFQPGADFSGVVVTLTGVDVPVGAAVTDSSGAYRFADVPVSLTGSAYTVTASRAYYQSAQTSVTAVPNDTATATPVTLVVDPASVSGSAFLYDNVASSGNNATSAGVDIALSGTAFNGTAFARATTTLSSGAFTLAPLPAGTYDVVATNPSRTCAAFSRVTVPPGGTVPVGSVRCTDTVAPGAVVLSDPVPPAGAQPGYTNQTTVAVPIAVQAGDATAPSSNFRGYQAFAGPVPDWARAAVVPGAPASITFTGLAQNARSTLWVRGIDWVGNAGDAASVQVVHDGVPPPTPGISTPRSMVNATTTSVTLSGSESDANFANYQTCTQTIAATSACPGAPGCTFADAPSASFALSLVAGQKTCLYARGRDRAGNSSGSAVTGVISDLVPPTGPGIAPLYDPTSLLVHGEYVDFSVTAPATDGPAGGGTAWKNVAWVEVDAGNGFVPLCPTPSCRPGDAYNPCDPGCGCTDPALRCRGTSLVAIRLPLQGNRANEIAVRAVDLAGNVGSGAVQEVRTTPDETIARAAPGMDETPRVRGRLAVYVSLDPAASLYKSFLTDLGENRIWDPGDPTCPIAYPGNLSGPSKGEAVSDGLVVYVESQRYVRTLRPGPDGLWCSGDEGVFTIYDGGGTLTARWVAASPSADGKKERAAWAAHDGSNVWQIFVREPGANGLLDATGDVVYSVIGTSATGVGDIRLGGDVLLYRVGSGFTALNAGASGFSSVTSWALPSSAKGAGLSGDGKVLAWIDDAVPPVLHVKYAGANGDFEPGDVEVTRAGVGPQVISADVAVEGGHVAAVEHAVAGGSTYSIHHWSAGGDGVFGTADDTYARTLPSSRPRFRPSLSSGVAAGRLYYTIGASGIAGEDPDILSTDLTATRWEVARQAAVSTPRTNGVGTLFYQDTDLWPMARTSDGRETRSPRFGTFAADGNALYLASGASLYLEQPDASGQWFTASAPAEALIYGGMRGTLEAGDGLLIAETSQASNALSVLRWNGATTDVVRLDDAPAFSTATGHFSAFGFGVSRDHAAWQALVSGSGYRVAVRSSVNGVFGDGDDVTGYVQKVGSPGTYYFGTSIAVTGNRLVLETPTGFAGDYHLVVVDAGADRTLNTADDTEIDLGVVGNFASGTMDAAGDMVAWTDFVPGLGGTQVNVVDLRDLSRRTLTDWYSFKPEIRVEPSGRLYWVDQIFQANSIFVWAP